MDKQKKLRVFYSDISALREQIRSTTVVGVFVLRQTTENKTM